MPSRPQLHHGQSTSPRTSSNAVNEIARALQRKLTANHIEATPVPEGPPSRRSSFSMENILHLKKDKDKKHDGKRSGRNSRRNSVELRPGSKSRDRVASKASPKVAPVKPAHFETTVESSPLLMIGTPNGSTGALLSTKIKLKIDDPSGAVTFTSWSRKLQAASTTHKPIGKECRQCMTHYDILDEKQIISKPTTYRADKDNFVPFQYLFNGRLPATTSSVLGGVAYELVITATTSTGETITSTHQLTLKRAVPPGNPKTSIRIFPPTNLTGRVLLPSVVHPLGSFPVHMTLSGVVENNPQSTVRWRVRKLMWRIDEHQKVISQPCEKHEHKVSGAGKALSYEDTRTLGSGELKTGWKSDFDTIGGEIMAEFECSVSTKQSHKPVCNVNSPRGFEVFHTLVLELIVAEEFSPHKSPQVITPTGAARVLRMQFNLVVTERAGMGISWDEEQPPMYEDVPGSPPRYGPTRSDSDVTAAEVLDYDGPEIEYEELERLESTDPDGPPAYRERAVDVNMGLPMRFERPRPTTSESDVGPSETQRRTGGWTLDELEAEPAQWRHRQESVDAEAQPEEDYGEGTSGAAAATTQQP